MQEEIGFNQIKSLPRVKPGNRVHLSLGDGWLVNFEAVSCPDGCGFKWKLTLIQAEKKITEADVDFVLEILGKSKFGIDDGWRVTFCPPWVDFECPFNAQDLAWIVKQNQMNEVEQREAEYTRLIADYQDLTDSPVFRSLERRRIKPHQVTVDNSLKLFALELRLKALEAELSVMDPNFEFTTIFLGEIVFGLWDNLKTPGRYWVSWWTANTPEVGVTEWPKSLKIWNTGSSGNRDSLCAMVDTDRETSLAQFWEHLVTYFPDAEVRFCTVKGYHEVPGDRFIDFDPARTFLRSPKNPESGVSQ